MESLLGDVIFDPDQQQKRIRQADPRYLYLGYPAKLRLDELLQAEISTLNTKHWKGITLTSK